MSWLKQLVVIITSGILAWGASSLHANQEKVFAYGDFGVPENLHPLTAKQTVEKRLLQLVFDSLIIENQTGDFHLSLAKELDISPDGLSYTFILRENLFWQDGKPLTARDVEFTLELLLQQQRSDYFAQFVKFVEDFTFIHPHALTITLSRPFYRPLSLFTFKILPKHQFEQPQVAPIGCGPFMYQSGLGSEKITLVRNPYFRYRQPPYFDKIVLHAYQDRQQARADLLQGKLDLLTEATPEDVLFFQKKQEFVVSKYSEKNIHLLAFHYQRQNAQEFLEHTLFRRALLQAIDREAFLEKITSLPFEKIAQQIATGPFPHDSWAYDKSISPYQHDIHYAQRTLERIFEKHGYSKDQGVWTKQGKSFQLKIAYRPFQQNAEIVVKQISESLASLGIEVVLKQISQFSPDQDYDLTYRTFTFNNILDIFFLFAADSVHFYRDSRLVELLYQLKNTLNPWSIRKLCHQIHRFLHEQVVHLFLWQLPSTAIYRQQLDGVVIHPNYFFCFPERWKKIPQ